MSFLFLSRLTALDFLARPIYKRGTKVGAYASLFVVVAFFWYAIQTIVEASQSQTVTTSVNTTPYDTNSTLTWTIRCPTVDKLSNPVFWGVYDETGENVIDNKYFTHCFVYAPSCAALTVKGKKPTDNLFKNTIFIAAGATTVIEICHEVQSFYSGPAKLEDGGVDCMANPTWTFDYPVSERTSWPLTSYSGATPNIDKLEFNEGFMAPAGEIYTYSSVISSDLNGVITDSSFMSSTGETPTMPSGAALQPLIEFLCKPGEFNYTYITRESGWYLGELSALPGVYSQSTLNYKTETVNNLRSNTLNVLGSIGGAWTGFCLLAGIALTAYFMFYPVTSAPVDYQVLGINNPDIYEPPKERQQPWLLKFDILMAPIYSLGTAIGTGITLLTFVGTLIYLIYLFSNASGSDITTTNVFLTPKRSSKTIPWTVTCPNELKETRFDGQESFYTHCIFVQPECADHKFQSIKTGETKKIQTCLQTALLYSGAAVINADGSKVKCEGSPNNVFPVMAYGALNEEVDNYPTVQELDNQTLAITRVLGLKINQLTRLEGETMFSYLLSSVAAPAVGDTKQDIANQSIAMSALNLCEDPNFNYTDAMILPPGPGNDGEISLMPEAYKYSPQYLDISIQNELRSNWLALIGSASGAMTGLLSLCALFYLFILIKFPAPRLNAVALGYISKEKEAINEKTTPEVPKKLSWFDYADILVEPLYNNPTSGGGILSISAFILYVFYVVYTFIQAGSTILQSTSIEITPKSSNAVIAKLTFTCPPASELTFPYYQEDMQFANCFIYSPNCTTLGTNGLVMLKPEGRKEIDLCIQRNPFYAGMIADLNSVNCNGTNEDLQFGQLESLSLPFLAWNSYKSSGALLELADQGGEMSFFSDGESYTYLKMVEEDISGPSVVSHVLTQRDSAPQVSAGKIATALQPLADRICKNTFSLSKLYSGNYSGKLYDQELVAPAPYSFSSIYYTSKRVNTLRSSWLSILGAIAGAWGSIIGLFQGIYLLLKMIYPPDPLDLVELKIISSNKIKESAVIKEEAVSPGFAGSPEKLIPKD